MLQRKSKKIQKKLQNSLIQDPISICSAFKKYDFDELAIFYPPLSKYVHFSSSGVSVIDWKDPQALRELTKAILIHKFQIKYWELPSKFLCPTIPSRINYLEWIDSLLKNEKKNADFVKGLDIGTGASLIYPILGYKLFKWHFVASEKNPEAYKNALEIQTNNDFQPFIEMRLAKDGIFKGIIKKNDDLFDFSMCNPPFFENLREQKTVNWRTCEIKEFEAEFQGGELEFVKQIFDESLEFKKKVKFFTSLIGRKKDYEAILIYLNNKKENDHFEIISKALHIGQNTRWVIAWRFL